MSFNSVLPVWNATGAEPPQTEKDNGWAAQEKPPADWFNWLFNKGFLALQELQQKAMENGGNVPYISSGLDSARPAAGNVNHFYISTDKKVIYRDNGTTWDNITLAAQDAATTSVTLNRGQNLVTTTSDASTIPFNVLNITGRTLINLLGRDGNCEDITKWSTTNASLALDSTNKVYGGNGLKITISSTSGSANRVGVIYKGGCYYIALADVKNGNATSVGIFNNGGGASALITDTSKFNTVWFKFTNSSDFNDYVITKVNGANTQYAYVDGVRLYQITQAEYNALDTMTIDQIASKYPYVDDMKSLTNPYLTVYGQNLAGIGSSWTIGASTSTFTVSALTNQAYTLSKAGTSTTTIAFLDANGTALTAELTGTQTSPAGAKSIRLTTNLISVVDIDNEKIMLNLGSTALPFVPRNDNPVYLTTALRASVDGSVADSLTFENGQYVKTKRFSEMVLDGSLGWTFSTDATGYKNVCVTNPANSVIQSDRAVKYDGKILTSVTSLSASDQSSLNSNGAFYISIADTDSGWGETYTPTAQEIQAYFYGWKMTISGDANGTTNYTGTGTKAWVSIASWNGSSYYMAGAVTAIPVTQAPNFTPYRLQYQLANPVQETVQSEGVTPSLASGMNQVELGESVIVREQANFKLYTSNGNYYLNDTGVQSPLKYYPSNIIAVYKNGVLEPRAILIYDSASYGGKVRVKINGSDYDTTAAYSVTYIAQPYQLSASILSLEGSYESNLRKDVDRNTQNISDLGELVTSVEETKANRQQPNYILVTGWLGGWTNTDSNRPTGYYKDELGNVHIRMRLRSGTIGQTVFYLPSGYRPSMQLSYPAVSYNASSWVPSAVDVMPDGRVIPSVGANSDFVCGEIIFRAEQ